MAMLILLVVLGASAPESVLDDASSCNGVTQCRSACDRGEATACRELGSRLRHGVQTRADVPAARAAYGKSCELGDGRACFVRAQYEVHGWGGRKGTHEDTCRWLERACDAKNGEGCDSLAHGYKGGECSRGGQADLARAIPLFQKACDLEFGDACLALGVMYLDGVGVPKDQARARDFHTRACRFRAYKACLAVATDKAVNKTFKTAEEIDALLIEPCKHGEGHACLQLSVHYVDGTAGRKDLHKGLSNAREACRLGVVDGCDQALFVLRQLDPKAGDTLEATLLIEDMCNLGRAEACPVVANKYLQGRSVPFHDRRRAVELFDRGCRADERHCAVRDEVCALESSKAECERVRRKPAEWSWADVRSSEKACDAKKAKGCVELAYVHLHGERVSRDLARAAALYQRACALKDDTSCVRAAQLRLLTGTLEEREVKQLLEGPCRRGEHLACSIFGSRRCEPGSKPETCATTLPLVEKACKAGLNVACVNAAVTWREGRTGKVDMEQSVRLLALACDQGHPGACSELTVRYSLGDGVAKDTARALKFMRRSCNSGTQEHCKLLQENCERGLTEACETKPAPEAVRPVR